MGFAGKNYVNLTVLRPDPKGFAHRRVEVAGHTRLAPMHPVQSLFAWNCSDANPLSGARRRQSQRPRIANPAKSRQRRKSDTHNWLGRSALNCRLTRSSGRSAAASLMVVRTTLPRLTPCRPRRFMSRSTVQRATVMRSRLICLPDLIGAVDLHIGLPDPLDL